MSMSSNEVVLALGVLLSIAACDKKGNESAPPAASAASAPAASPGDTERKDREHGRDERADGGREREHEERPK
jgi:predicted small lipoprotein YifL